jgi:hypothetical protein
METVRRALGKETLDIFDWTCETLQPGYGESSGGVYRVAGNGRDREALLPWSRVLKIICRPGLGSTSTVAQFFDVVVATHPAAPGTLHRRPCRLTQAQDIPRLLPDIFFVSAASNSNYS